MDGQWVDEQDLKISAFDLSVLRGFGVFDFLRTYHHVPFELDTHVDRLFDSAKAIGLDAPWDRNQIKELVKIGIEKNQNGQDLEVRIVATGGVSSDFITPGKPSLIMIFHPLTTYPGECYTEGVKVITFSSKRFLPASKSLNYLAAVVATRQAHGEGAVEALYVDEQGRINEGTTSNFLAVVGDSLITPPVSEILLGVTREVIIKLAASEGIKMEEKPLYVRDISQFQEAIITSTTKEIMPVVKINDQIVGDGKVGPITRRLANSFKSFVNSI